MPRSLDPLPHESLPGYLLRLAHRLERTPGRIASLTGLAEPGSRGWRPVPAAAMLALDTWQARRFAEATRLSADEVENMGLRRLARRYAPLRGTGTGSRVTVRDLARSSRYWVLIDATRYCPQCLAGDGSAIQAAHGGGWQQLWRLPLIVACVRHQRLLSYYCPQCKQPAHLSRRDFIVPRMGDPGLHPARCRGTVPKPGRPAEPGACGARLDTPDSQDPGIAAELLGPILTQQRAVLGALDCDGTVSETDACWLTGDLIALSGLIKMSWPAGDQFVRPCLREQVAAHVERTRHAVTQLCGSSADLALSLMRRPPGDPATCAALLLAADHILALGWRERREATAP